ncbi:MAG: bifunctional nuclease family protein [Ignavibacteriaceae bacterium]|nr:bifunctional nuclease family protein [Ignavibacteriaceae bacterium]
MNKVECEVAALSSSPSPGGAYALILKEVYGNRKLPIVIGQFEAQAIALELQGEKPSRPLTHDLIKTIIENLGATVEEIVITELRDSTYYAKIVLEQSALTNEVDARPSDAIAIALRTQSPIFVSERVFDLAGFISTGDTVADAMEEEERVKETNSGRESKVAALQNQLREALENEDYERAARLRDEINKLQGGFSQH